MGVDLKLVGEGLYTDLFSISFAYKAAFVSFNSPGMGVTLLGKYSRAAFHVFSTSPFLLAFVEAANK